MAAKLLDNFYHKISDWEKDLRNTWCLSNLDDHLNHIGCFKKNTKFPTPENSDTVGEGEYQESVVF